MNKFWKRLGEVGDELVDNEIYLVKVDTFGLDNRGRPEYTSWTTRGRMVKALNALPTFLEPVTGESINSTYNTVTHVLIKPSMLELQTHIHEQNVEKGWWKSPRCFSTMTNLFISENSEALEGDRRNLMDDKLKHHPMRVVEIADMCIRVFDYLGSIGYQDYFEDVSISYKEGDFQYNLALTTYYLTQAWLEEDSERGIDPVDVLLNQAINLGFQMIRDMGYDPIEIILEKHDFNAVRHDHKLENRTTGKPGAKAY